MTRSPWQSIAAMVLFVSATASADWLVTDDQLDSVKRFSESGTYLGDFVTSGSGGLDSPHACVIGPGGDLYVSSHWTHSIKQYDGRDGAYVGDFVPSRSGGLERPTGLAFGPDLNEDGEQDLVVSSTLTGEVLGYSGLDGSFLGVVLSGLCCPDGLLFSSDANYLYVVDNGTHSVHRVKMSTGLEDPPGAYLSGGVSFPADCTFGRDFLLYVTGHESHNVVRYDPLHGAMVDIPVDHTSGVDGPQALAFGPDGHLYVVSERTKSVKRYDGRTMEFMGDFVTPGDGGLVKPVGLCHAADLMTVPADVNRDGVVDFVDLLELLSAWGTGG